VLQLLNIRCGPSLGFGNEILATMRREANTQTPFLRKLIEVILRERMQV
jgi:hypothetical protein